MACLPLIVQSETQTRIGLALTVWLQMCRVMEPTSRLGFQKLINLDIEHEKVLRDAISRRHGLNVPHGKVLDPIKAELVEGLPSNVIDNDESNIANIYPLDTWATWRMKLANQMKWVPEEDAMLVACMVNLYNVGTYNRIRTLKRDWEIFYDMLNGKFNSGFAADIVEEIDVKEVATANNLKEGNNYHGCEDDVSLEEKKIFDVAIANNLEERNNYRGCEDDVSLDEMDAIGLELSKSIASEKVLQESAQKSYPALCEVEGLTEDKRYCAMSKIPDHQM
ncbi:hypothetical protein Gotur_002662 [Gossypium turneri]